MLMRRVIGFGALVGTSLSLVACGSSSSGAGEPSGAAATAIPSAAPSAEDSQAYEQQTALQKQEALWNVIKADEYCKTDVNSAADYATINNCTDDGEGNTPLLPSGGAGYTLAAIPALFNLGPTFTHSSDLLPEGRQKIFHPFGVAGKAAYVPMGGKYTGMFENTGKEVPLIVRMGPGGGKKLIPGLAVKFLADGVPSVNGNAIEDPGGQADGDLNYFHSTPSNILKPNDSLLLAAVNLAFQKFAKDDPTHLKLTHIASLTPQGKAVPAAQVVEPFQIQYRPHGSIATDFGNEQGLDFRVDLRKIPPGTTIYDVYAKDSESGQFEQIGAIKTQSYLIASGGADYKLFFRHYREPTDSHEQ